MSYKYMILSFALALALSPSASFAQSSDTVVNNTNVRGMRSFQGGTAGMNTPASRFGAYASGITFSPPQRTSSNPLTSSQGLRSSGPAPGRDFRLSSGLINTRATSGPLPAYSGLPSRPMTSYLNRLSFQRPITPIRRFRSNPSPLAGVPNQAFRNRDFLSPGSHRAGTRSLATLDGFHSRTSLSRQTSTSRKKSLANQNSPVFSTSSLSQRGFNTRSQVN